MACSISWVILKMNAYLEANNSHKVWLAYWDKDYVCLPVYLIIYATEKWDRSRHIGVSSYSQTAVTICSVLLWWRVWGAGKINDAGMGLRGRSGQTQLIGTSYFLSMSCSGPGRYFITVSMMLSSSSPSSPQPEGTAFLGRVREPSDACSIAAAASASASSRFLRPYCTHTHTHTHKIRVMHWAGKLSIVSCVLVKMSHILKQPTGLVELGFQWSSGNSYHYTGYFVLK